MLILYRHKLIFKGIIDSTNHELFGGIQLEIINAGNMYSGIYSGFSDLDYGLVSILCTFIGMKFTHIKEKKTSKKKDEIHMGAFNVISEMLKNRTDMEFLMNARDIIPRVVGYEHIGIYIHDPASSYYII